MNEIELARIRVYRNDPAGRGDRLVSSDPPLHTQEGPWGFRVEGRTPEPRAYEPDTREFLHWQLSAALERGKRLWAERLPLGGWVAGPVLPAVPVAGEDLNAYYDRRALHFFRYTDPATGRTVQSGESTDIVIHEQGHAILDAIRPDLWDAPHFEAAAFHEAFGDLASILVALAEPEVTGSALEETLGDPSRANLVSRLAEELGAAVRARYGADAAMPGALRDAVNEFTYTDPSGLPDSAPASKLSAEPHSFCRVMTGGCWDVLVALFRADPRPERPAALRAAAQALSRYAVAASETAPAGADFFARVARRIVREARASNDASAPALAEILFRRGLLSSPQVGDDLRPDEDPGLTAPEEGAPLPAPVSSAIEARLPPMPRGEIRTLSMRRGVLRGRRKRDLVLHGKEYGPADGAAVEISDAFALSFSDSGFLRASRAHPATAGDEEDARAFVRFLARGDRIAEASDRFPESQALVRQRRSHAVVREADGLRRLRRVWVQREDP